MQHFLLVLLLCSITFVCREQMIMFTTIIWYVLFFSHIHFFTHIFINIFRTNNWNFFIAVSIEINEAILRTNWRILYFISFFVQKSFKMQKYQSKSIIIHQWLTEVYWNQHFIGSSVFWITVKWKIEICRDR